MQMVVRGNHIDVNDPKENSMDRQLLHCERPTKLCGIDDAVADWPNETLWNGTARA